MLVAVFATGYVKSITNGIIPDFIIDWIGENKLKAGMIGYFAGNLVSGFISNTGAFEIYCNDQLIWSAVNYGGKVPQIDYIIKLIKNAGFKLMD